MEKLLLVVEESFQITGRYVVLLPEVNPQILGSDVDGHTARVRFKRPDKTECETEFTFSCEHFQIANGGSGWKFIATWRDGTKDDVPPGTEVWLLGAP